ncbi:hypothetical protein BYT27DRAFT_7341980, partial [Phlegmacium glaucopus]
MIIKVLSDSTFGYMQRVVRDQWEMQRSFVRTQAVRAIGYSGTSARFEDFFSELRYLHQLYECGKSFDVVLRIGDPDVAIIQDAINIASDHPELEKFLAESLAYSHELMDERQRECFGFNGWYAGLMEK